MANVFKSLKVTKNEGEKNKMAVMISNIFQCFMLQGKWDEITDYYHFFVAYQTYAGGQWPGVYVIVFI